MAEYMDNLSEEILDFIEDNRPTDVRTDWERGCAYICEEIEEMMMSKSFIASCIVLRKTKLLDFIKDNRPTYVQSDWEEGCAYVCDEIKKLLM